jgi:hypothetical protein
MCSGMAEFGKSSVCTYTRIFWLPPYQEERLVFTFIPKNDHEKIIDNVHNNVKFCSKSTNINTYFCPSFLKYEKCLVAMLVNHFHGIQHLLKKE